MSAPQIVGVGMATLDVLIRLKNMPTWENGGRIQGFSLDGGGPVATAMVAAARLGCDVGYVGACGNDKAAELKIEFLKKYGIDISHMVHYDGPEQNVVIVYVDASSGERVFSGLSHWEGRTVGADELDRDYITSAEYLHLDGYNDEAALQAAKWMQAEGKSVVYDGHKTNADSVPAFTRELLGYVDILICGEGFGRALTGEEDLWEAGRAALDVGPSIVVQTEGADGSYTVTADDAFHTPAFEVDVVDTTGAGDVFHGAYIVGMLQDWDLRTVAYFSTAVSALKCQGLGGRAPIPCFDETIEFLKERGIPIE